MSEMSSRTRFKLDLEEGLQSEALFELMNSSGIDSAADLFNNALSLYNWMLEERRKGRVIASIDEATQRYQELVLPDLTNRGGEL